MVLKLHLQEYQVSLRYILFRRVVFCTVTDICMLSRSSGDSGAFVIRLQQCRFQKY